MKTTFVFGAGASRGIGYPLANDMGAGLLSYMVASENPSIRSSGEFLEERFGRFPDIEELMTGLQSQIDSLGESASLDDRIERAGLAQARALIGHALQEWFRAIHTQPSPNYAKFAQEVIQAGDAVITFNYDDSLERELRRAGKWNIGRAMDSTSMLWLSLPTPWF
jgi:hypothetical protein